MARACESGAMCRKVRAVAQRRAAGNVSGSQSRPRSTLFTNALPPTSGEVTTPQVYTDKRYDDQSKSYCNLLTVRPGTYCCWMAGRPRSCTPLEHTNITTERHQIMFTLTTQTVRRWTMR